MDNNQIFRNWFVIIHRHLTKVSAQIIQCIIFDCYELSITVSTLWSNSLQVLRRQLCKLGQIHCKHCEDSSVKEVALTAGIAKTVL